jgi:Zn-dependent protease with chaperone function
MDFFGHQQQAKRLSRHLYLAFAVAILLVAALTGFVIAAIATQLSGQWVFLQAPMAEWGRLSLTSPYFFYSTATVAVILLGAAALKMLTLGGDGIRLAQSLNGQYLSPATTEPSQRRLLNLVEEMALASGNPVPKVFIIPDVNINAFAAGYDRHHIVIGLTQGAIECLNRDELQSVIAHEFSHILFGDVKINMRLMGLIFGITVISHCGRLLLETRSMTHSRNSRNGLPLVGLALVAIGSVGTFAGLAIRAAVSRQREFLADAAAVQFTRQAEPLARALARIHAGQRAAGLSSKLQGAQADMLGHFCFAEIRSAFWLSALNTHPATAERIKRLGFSEMPLVSAPKSHENAIDPHSIDPHSIEPKNPSALPGANSLVPPFQSLNGAGVSPSDLGDTLVAKMGGPTTVDLESAENALRQLPADLYEATQTPYSARALVYALLYHYTAPAYRDAQAAVIAEQAHPNTQIAFNQLRGRLSNVTLSMTFELLLLSQRALQDQSLPQAEHYRAIGKALIAADGQFNLIEWCIYRLGTASWTPCPRESVNHLASAQDALSILLHFCVKHLAVDAQIRRIAGAEQHLALRLTRPASLSIQQLDKSLMSLAKLKPLAKAKVLKAVVMVLHESLVDNGESYTLIRMTALLLDCPAPATISMPV